MSGRAQIQNVSDTALWVAVYRARESERSDALFRDPLAWKLAGERGKQIAASMPFSRIMQWTLSVRTVAIDRLITRAIAEGVDAVINIGAGLDTRPYRMDLPSTLRWIEVDLPQIIEHKDKVLRDEKARCHLERVTMDLSQRGERQQFFRRVSLENKKVLIITEGLLPYLTNGEVDGLARDLAATPNFTLWIQDYRDGAFGGGGRHLLKRQLQHAPFRFVVQEWMPWFAQRGWAALQTITSVDEARRVNRPFPFLLSLRYFLWFLSARRREEMRRGYGYVLLQRQDIK